MTANLRFRLLLLLLVPLMLLAFMGGWFGYTSADEASTQHDQRLMRLLPALADSVLAPSIADGTPPLVSFTPAMEDFLREQGDQVGYAVGDLQGHVIAGDAWIRFDVPTTALAEFHSQEHGGVTYRVAVLKAETYGAGELVVMVADSSDVRQQWVRQLLLHVLLPNLLLIAGAAVAIYWSVSRAFKPLHKLTQAVERRSPRDLNPIDEQSSPAEVRPLVRSLNRLFSLVNAQAEGQRRFVADAAHQLRTPLAALQAQVEAWALSAESAQRAARRKGEGEAPVVLSLAQIEQLRDATRRTSQLARQLLALSRADARNAEVQPLQQVDLKELCESMLETFIDRASAKALDFGLETESVAVWGHSWLLRELVSNLVENAIKYTPAGGSVTLRCGRRARPLGSDDATLPASAPSGWAFVEVDDDGPGVPVQERGQITQRFYRAQGAVGEGTGLGLAIADEIAQLHQGVLSFADGSCQKGLLVRLELPIQLCADGNNDGRAGAEG